MGKGIINYDAEETNRLLAFIKEILDGGGINLDAPKDGNIYGQKDGEWAKAQEQLESGKNIKTLNGVSLLGEGNIDVAPTIGENGNWYINGLDTGKPAKGKDGADGVSLGEIALVQETGTGSGSENKVMSQAAVTKGFNGIDEKINNRTTEYNVSVNHPTSGTDGTNRYDLAGAIAQVPAELRSSGLTVSFLNESGDTEKWEFAGGSWAVSGFSQVGVNKIKKLDNQVFDLETGKISTDGTYDKKRVLEPSASSEWQTFDNPFPDNIDCDINVNNPNRQTIFIAFSSVKTYQGQQYFYANLLVKGQTQISITKQGKTPSRAEYPYILVLGADDDSIKITISAGEDKNIFDDIKKVDDKIISVEEKADKASNDVQAVQTEINGGEKIFFEKQGASASYSYTENNIPQGVVNYIINGNSQWAEIYFSKDQTGNNLLMINRNTSEVSGTFEAPNPEEYPYIAYKAYNPSAYAKLYTTELSLKEEVKENTEKIENIEKTIETIGTSNSNGVNLPLQVGILCYVFDDGSATDDNYVPLLNEKGIKATFALIGKLPPEKWDRAPIYKEYLKKGNGVVGHGPLGTNSVNDSYIKMSDEESYKCLSNVIMALDYWGFPHNGMVYPENGRDTHAKHIISKAYKYAIGSVEQPNLTDENVYKSAVSINSDIYELERYNVEANTLDSLKKAINYCIENRTILILWSHSSNIGNSTLSSEEYNQLLDFIKEKIDNYELVSMTTDEAVNTFFVNKYLSNNKIVYPLPRIGSMYYDGGLKVCTNEGKKEISYLKLSGNPTGGNLIFTIAGSARKNVVNTQTVTIDCAEVTTVSQLIDKLMELHYTMQTPIRMDDGVKFICDIYGNQEDANVTENPTGCIATFDIAQGIDSVYS